jgi:hypothetical protein
MTEATSEVVPVTQADRDAAASIMRAALIRYALSSGDCDDDPVVQAFARHRRTTEARIEELAEALSDKPDALIDGLADRIKYVFEFNGCGFWRTCSGCYESEDGYPNGIYPHSNVLGCTLGAGCSECGGLGATYDPADYEEMAREMLAEDALTNPEASKPLQEGASHE